MVFKDKPCRKCGATFPPVNSKSQWCESCSRFKCKCCGAAFSRGPSTCRVYRFCSTACYLKTRWTGRRLVKRCVICGVAFETVKSADNKTCSWQCRSKQISRMHRGKRSHFWRGGATAPYTDEWQENRRAALARDGRQCTSCGATKSLIVHHLNPYRYSFSHSLDNLTTLCRSCHGKIEYSINKAARRGLILGRMETASAQRNRASEASVLD